MQQIEVDVAQSARLERLLYGRFGVRVPVVVLQLRGVEDRLARGAGLLAEVKNRAAALPLVLVPLRGVLGQSDRG